MLKYLKYIKAIALRKSASSLTRGGSGSIGEYFEPFRGKYN